MAEIPDHCPYPAGARVQLHGYPGNHVHAGMNIDDPRVTGLVGVVTSYLGGTTLAVHVGSDTLMVEWGSLDPHGTVCHDTRCGCCPHPGGVCRPDLASTTRAQQVARDMAAWWRRGAPHPRVLAAERDRRVRPARPEPVQLELFTA